MLKEFHEYPEVVWATFFGFISGFWMGGQGWIWICQKSLFNAPKFVGNIEAQSWTLVIGSLILAIFFGIKCAGLYKEAAENGLFTL